MPLQYKIDVLNALKDKGYSSYNLRNQNLLSQSTLTKLRNGQGIAWENIEKLCELLDCQPADILEYKKD